jgi:hypothetical protein
MSLHAVDWDAPCYGIHRKLELNIARRFIADIECLTSIPLPFTTASLVRGLYLLLCLMYVMYWEAVS